MNNHQNDNNDNNNLSYEEKIRFIVQQIPRDKDKAIFVDIRQKLRIYGSLTEGQATIVDSTYRRFQNMINHVITKSLEEDQCKACLDVGVLRVDHDGVGTLALCDCKQGDLQPWKLPKASKIGGRTQPLPWQEFKPDLEAHSGNIGRAIREKQSWWREKIGIAEEFWKSKNL